MIGISNGRARNINDYGIFDHNTMNTSIIKSKISIFQFESKPMMLQTMQAIG